MHVQGPTEVVFSDSLKPERYERRTHPKHPRPSPRLTEPLDRFQVEASVYRENKAHSRLPAPSRALDLVTRKPSRFGRIGPCVTKTSVMRDVLCYIWSITMDITSIARDQNRWWTDPRHRETRRFRHRRDVFRELLSYLGENPQGRAAALLGPRQVGKTTLLLQIADELLDRGWPAGNLTFFDFSDERLLAPGSPRDIVRISPLGASIEHPRVFLFDEIQNVPDWQKWLKGAVDQSRRAPLPGTRFIVTGSAAASLRRGGVESGQGRWDEIAIEGLTLAEFLAISAGPDDSRPSAVLDPQAYARYLEVGGFPEHLSPLVPVREARQRIRDDIADRAVLRDLLHTGLDVERLRRLLVYLINGSGNAWNQAKRAEDLDANRKSVAEWLIALEETRLIVRLDRDKPAQSKARTQLRQQTKIFASDHGLVTAFASAPEPLSAPDVRSRVFEAAVFRHLREVARRQGGNLSFGRLDDHLEIDFILRYGSHSIGVEVTSSPEAKPRKLARALQATRSMAIDRKLLVHGGLVSDLASDIKLVPFHEFLIDPHRYVGEET
jgi:predicted AAA+ superfamily ATPase